MGKAREQELRVTALGMIALVLLAALLVFRAVALGGKLHVCSRRPVRGAQDVGGASAPYVQRAPSRCRQLPARGAGGPAGRRRRAATRR